MNKTKRLVLYFRWVAGLGLGLLAGCAMLESPEGSAAPATDEGIAALASSRLNGDAMVARATLSVTVENGQAILAGTVPDEATRQRALQILQATPGIVDVRDRTRRR